MGKTIKNFPNRNNSLKSLLTRYKKERIDIAIDGGVTIENLIPYLNNGASMFIFGTSGLFIEGVDLRNQIRLIKKTLEII